MPPSSNKRAQATEIRPVPFGVIATIGAALVLFTLLIYSNSFGGSFIYDDDQAINKNTSIHHLWSWDSVSPPYNLTVGGRPLLNLSFAINYAISGMNPWSYHVLNFTVHALVGLVLLGVLRRTFLQPVMRNTFGPEALLLSTVIALLWLVNPLQTESVSYISQRAEALMALCYLLTIYCFIRFTDSESPNPILWAVLSVVACTCGAAFKEITVSAPIAVLLYDRTFVARSFGEAAERRWPYYILLATFCWLVIWHGTWDIVGRVVGYHYGVTAWDYALTECPALVHYMVLMIWPHPLIIDYGTRIFRFWDPNDFLEAAPYGVLVVSLLVATVVALFRWPRVGFICAWFFLILAPTSSFFPIVVSPIGEHRLYLPLLTFLVPLILTLRYLKDPISWIWIIAAAALWAFIYGLVADTWYTVLVPGVLALRYIKGAEFWGPVVALGLIWSTLAYMRNSDYSTDVSLWRVTVAQEPDNARAHNNYGVTLLGSGHAADAAAQFEMATTIQPSYPDAHYNWGNAAAELGHYQEAIGHYQVALSQKPTMGSAENNWGNALDAMGIKYEPEAIDHYLAAVQMNPNEAQFHYNLGHGYLMMKRLPDALTQFQLALQLNPNMPDTHNTLGIIYYQMGLRDKAIEEFQNALELNPNLQAARDNLNRITGAIVVPANTNSNPKP